MKRFQDKVVIVTGGASGIGLATAKAFLTEGAKVVVADYSEEGQKVADDFNAQGYDCLFIKGDVAKEADVINTVEQTVAKYGRLDVMFANAGIAEESPLADTSLADWQRVVDINLTGVFLCDKYAIQQMLKQDGGGAIVNCGSIHSYVGVPSGAAGYPAAKGGVKMLTASAALDYANKGVRINAVCPGYIDTPLLKDIDEAARNYLVSLHPVGRLGQPEDVANAVLFLADDASAFINGVSLLVDGGYVAR